MRPRLLALAFIAAAVAPIGRAQAADGLSPPPGTDVWPQWQARITVNTATLAPVTLAPSRDAARTAVQSGAVLGDFYLDAPGLRLPQSLGGLRATGGLLLGARGLAPGGGAVSAASGRFGLVLQNAGLPATVADGATDAVPYLGIGYTGLAAKGGWGVTADVGLVAENPAGASRMGRAVFGNSGFEGALRELRLSPVLQLGVRYAF
jgi:hypothetical protein